MITRRRKPATGGRPHPAVVAALQLAGLEADEPCDLEYNEHRRALGHAREALELAQDFAEERLWSEAYLAIDEARGHWATIGGSFEDHEATAIEIRDMMEEIPDEDDAATA